MIRDARPKDAEGVVAIYNHYVRNTTTTFEEVDVAVSDMAARMAGASAQHPWLVAEADPSGEVLGYAYATPWRSRSAYRRTVEISVYLLPDGGGRGLGTQLYEELLARLAATEARAVIGGVALPNEASVRLHERLGFEKVAHFQQVGFKHGRWVDVGYWQRLLES